MKEDLRQNPPGAQARQAARLQATALETAANSVMITDRDGVILCVNPAFTALTGYAAAEVIGKNPRLLKSGQHTPEFYRALWDTILNGRPWHGEFTNRRKDGSLYWDEHTITPVHGADGQITHFVAIMQDVTARKRAEDAVRRLTLDLEDRVRRRTAELHAANEELEAFAYSVSHDLRAPARHIRGFVQCLYDESAKGLQPAGRRYLDKIAETANRMDRLIEDLLRLSMVGRAELKPRRVNLDPLVDEAIREVGPEVGARKVIWERSPLPAVLADATLLQQAVVNLLANAVKYTRPREVARIQIGCDNGSGPEVTVFVRDNGVGFDERFADKLFNPFQRLHPREAFEGSGIGLASVRRIIARHGGRTWAEGKVDVGATFYFSLPRPGANLRP